MKKYNLIILAGGEDEAWCKQYGHTKKAFLPINHKPMLDRVIEAYRKSPHIGKIVIVGSKELSKLASMQHVHKLIPEAGSFIMNLLSAVFYMKRSLYKFAGKHDGYLISFCDAAYLTTEVIDATLENMLEHDPDIALHYVHKDVLGKAGFPIEDRSYLPINGKPYTGSNIYYVKKFTALLKVLRDISLFRKNRKQPKKILEHLGCEHKDFPEIAKVLSHRLSLQVKIFASPFAEMGVDVDKPSDYELAKTLLNKPYKRIEDAVDLKLDRTRVK